MDLISSTRREQANMYLKILKAVSETNYFEDMDYRIDGDNFIHLNVNSEDAEMICKISDILEMNIKMDTDGELVELVIVTDDKTVTIDNDGHMKGIDD